MNCHAESETRRRGAAREFKKLVWVGHFLFVKLQLVDRWPADKVASTFLRPISAAKVTAGSNERWRPVVLLGRAGKVSQEHGPLNCVTLLEHKTRVSKRANGGQARKQWQLLTISCPFLNRALN